MQGVVEGGTDVVNVRTPRRHRPGNTIGEQEMKPQSKKPWRSEE